ncbi:MAG: hypothetical protein ACYSWP_12905 [Planctomycetota bacterium]|jgi:hypothetical protein
MPKTQIKLRKFEPLPAEHPGIGEECTACRKEIKEGDILTLVPIGPGDDPEEMAKCYAGKAYNAQAIMIHWTCATGDPSPERDLVILPDGGGPLGSQ